MSISNTGTQIGEAVQALVAIGGRGRAPKVACQAAMILIKVCSPCLRPMKKPPMGVLSLSKPIGTEAAKWVLAFSKRT
jgi:hypothetical protein